MTTKHTQGPLFAERGWVFREADRAEPWTTRPAIADCDLAVETTEEAHANAVLFAAAADLLKAAKDVDRLLELREQMATCRRKHPKRGFGIAVDADPISLEFQALQKEASEIDQRRRDAIVAAYKGRS